MKNYFIGLFVILFCAGSHLDVFAMAYMPTEREYIVNSILNAEGGIIEIENVTILYDCDQKAAAYEYTLKNPTQSAQTIPIAFLLDHAEQLEVKENNIEKSYSVGMIYFLQRFQHLARDTQKRGFSYLSYETDSICQIIDYYKNFEATHFSGDKEVYVYEYLYTAEDSFLTGEYRSDLSILDGEDFGFDGKAYHENAQEGISRFEVNRKKRNAYGMENKTKSYFVEVQPKDTGESSVKLDSMEGVTKRKMKLKEFLLEYPYKTSFDRDSLTDYTLSEEGFLKYNLQSLESSYDYYNTETQTDIYRKVYETAHFASDLLPSDKIYFADISLEFSPGETKVISIAHAIQFGYRMKEDSSMEDAIHFDLRYLESFQQSGNVSVSVKTKGNVTDSNLNFQKQGDVYTVSFPFSEKESISIFLSK